MCSLMGYEGSRVICVASKITPLVNKTSVRFAPEETSNSTRFDSLKS